MKITSPSRASPRSRAFSPQFGKSAYPFLEQAIVEFIEDQRKERITVTKNIKELIILAITEKKSEGKLHYYLNNSIPMFNMNLEPQKVGLEECVAEII